MTTTVAELFTLMYPYIRACVAFNFTPLDAIEKAEAEVTAAKEPLKAALDALVEERDRLRFELDGVNAMREVAVQQAVEGVTLPKRITELIEQHGSLRGAASALYCDYSYLSRLHAGWKANPSDELLERMGLRRVITYERKD